MVKKAALKDRLTRIADEKKEAEKKPNDLVTENLVNMNTRLPDDMITEMKIYCVKNKMRIQDFVQVAVREALDKRK